MAFPGIAPRNPGDGRRAQFQLQKEYASGPAAYLRPIVKPVLGTVLIAVAGEARVETIDFTVDYATGVVTFTAPPGEGAAVTAGLASEFTMTPVSMPIPMSAFTLVSSSGVSAGACCWGAGV